MKQGDCFFNKAAPGLRSHPWVIISEPETGPDNVVIVNLTDAEGWDDRSCVLDVEDHPGVFTKLSCIAYRKAIITSVDKLEEARNLGVIFMKPPVPDQTLRKIFDGVTEKGELPNAHRAILQRQLLIF
jgi:hypothetical protein